MKKGLYVTFDKVAKQNSPVFQQANDHAAIRSFSQMLKETPFPGDFSLKRVGWIDDQGYITPDLEEDVQDNIETNPDHGEASI